MGQVLASAIRSKIFVLDDVLTGVSDSTARPLPALARSLTAARSWTPACCPR
jgi:hypothetical protein